MTRTAAGSNGLLRVAGRGRWTPEEEQRKLEGSEGRSAHRGAACRRPARPRCRPQSRTALPPRSAAPGAAAAPCAPPYGRSKLHRRPSEPLAGGRHRAAAPRLREHYPVYARAPCARTVWTAPKPVLRAGGRVAATAPSSCSAGRSSAIISRGCTLAPESPRGGVDAVLSQAHSGGGGTTRLVRDRISSEFMNCRGVLNPD